MEKKYKILFVCLGNICRSPAAEGILQKLLQKAKLSENIEVDSAGTYGVMPENCRTAECVPMPPAEDIS